MTSWKNCYKVLVKDCKNRLKVCLMHYSKYPLIELAPKSIGQTISNFLNCKTILSNWRTSKDRSNQSGDVMRILEIALSSIKRKK